MMIPRGPVYKSHSPNQSGPEEFKPDSQQRVINRIASVVVAISILLLIVGTREVENLERTIGGYHLALVSSIFGLLQGYVAYLAITRRYQFLKESSALLRLSLLFMIGLGTCSLSVGLASYLNRAYAGKPLFYRDVTVTYKASSARTRSPNSSEVRLIYFKLDGRKEHISVPEDFWMDLPEGSTVRLSLRQGLFRFPMVIAVGRIK